MTAVIVRAIQAASTGTGLSRAEIADVIGHIMDGEATPAQIGGLLIALKAKGETVDELVGSASAMRTRALPLTCPRLEHSIDTCGTGGDGAGTVNVSTLAAILIAACGGIVAKHGNRAQSSKCGSADVLETLGVKIDAEPAQITRCIEVAGIGFAFAPRFHAATKSVAGPRRELGTRTIFNLLGPLTNPAGVKHQVVGVYDRHWCEPMAAALGELGLRRAAVVHGAGGIDEIAVAGDTHVAIFDDDVVLARTLSPKSFGLDACGPEGLAGGDAAHNAQVLRKVLAGVQVGHGERYEAVLRAAAMTAALGLELLETGTLDLSRLPDQYVRASTVARDGAARLVLHKWALASNATPGADLSDLDLLRACDFEGLE
jgi:anthranilate phosphoribosyltransferase